MGRRMKKPYWAHDVLRRENKVYLQGMHQRGEAMRLAFCET